MKLSKNFSLKELVRSDMAERNGIDNNPKTQEHVAALAVLAHSILQPVRNEFGIVTITSGYRSEELNTLCRGSSTSSHCRGEAADFEVFSSDNIKVANWIKSNLEYDQLILEFYVKGIPDSGWVHCSYKRDGGNRKQDLTALKGKGGKTEYLEGLVDG